MVSRSDPNKPEAPAELRSLKRKLEGTGDVEAARAALAGLAEHGADMARDQPDGTALYMRDLAERIVRIYEEPSEESLRGAAEMAAHIREAPPEKLVSVALDIARSVEPGKRESFPSAVLWLCTIIDAMAARLATAEGIPVRPVEAAAVRSAYELTENASDEELIEACIGKRTAAGGPAIIDNVPKPGTNPIAVHAMMGTLMRALARALQRHVDANKAAPQ